MTLDNLLKILLAGGSLAAGAFLTALRARLASSKKKNKLHWGFYLTSGLILLGVLIALLSFWNEIFLQRNAFAIIVVAFAVVASIALLIATSKFLSGKFEYKSSELDPVVNKFSKDADKENIKLLAGNLDFLGQSPQQIERHSQYRCLREERFAQIHVLCTRPKSNQDKIRYGKIITDLPEVELKYYEPSHADLKVRGRIKTLNNVTRLLIYSKMESGRYEALELNTADTNGALYGHLWTLLWEIADSPNQEQLNEYKMLYRS